MLQIEYTRPHGPIKTLTISFRPALTITLKAGNVNTKHLLSRATTSRNQASYRRSVASCLFRSALSTQLQPRQP